VRLEYETPQLLVSGHFDFQRFQRIVPLASAGAAGTLASLVTEAKAVLTTWQSAVQAVRGEIPALNFFTVNELWHLALCLEALASSEPLPEPWPSALRAREGVA
jgi:hypothetical protein